MDQYDPESADSCSLTEEEVEPKLKYVRLSNDLKNILSEEAVSCIAVHSKFLCLGTHWGRIHMLDHQGNRVDTPINMRQNPHTLSVNKIAVDSKGEYIATCSDDGMVIISGLCTDENNQQLKVDKAIKAVELDPMHHKSGSGRRFIIGDNKLVLYEKTFLKGLKPTILSDSEGPVSAIKWNGQFIAWASSLGVHVYDLNERCSLGLIKWEDPKEGRLTDFRCNLNWSNQTTLLIGWVDTIRICVIRKRNPIEVSTRNLPTYIVDPMSTFQTEFYVCGIAPLESHQLVVLGFSKERDSETNKALRPILCVLQYKASDYIEICTDSLSMRGHQEYKCDDYHLDCLIEENQYFIVSPKDVVVASLYETDDRVQWLIEHGCTQWVEFCHCPETAERLSSGGPYGLRKFAICSEHFQASALAALDWNGQLPANTVPTRIGKTHMTQAMLLEKGFTLEPETENEAHPIDQVLVEMLSAEEMDEEPQDDSNFEFVGVKRIKVEQEELQFENEIKQEPVEEEQPQSPPSVAMEERATRESYDLNSKPTQKQDPCVNCANFKPRYEYEVRKNKRLEQVIARNKRKIADETIKMQKLHDRITLKQIKRAELKKKFYELRDRCKKGIPLDKIAQPVAESGNDETEAWW